MSKTMHPEEGFVTANGCKMHFLEWGRSGKSIVALHSMGMDAHGLDAFSESLAKEYRILAIDLLGHGDSDSPKGPTEMEEHADIIRKVALEKGHIKNILVGHSIGGWLSIIYAAKHPEEVEKLVLVDIAPRPPTAETTGRPTPPRPATPDSFDNEDEALKYLKIRYTGFTQESLENRLKHAFKKDPAGRLRLKSDPQRAENLRGGFTYDFWPFIRKIQAPTLLIRGSKSQTVSDESVRLMKEILKDFEVVKIDATHMVPQDQPKEFEKAVRDFLT